MRSGFKLVQRIVILFSVLFLINTLDVEASVSRPNLQSVDWRTGELQVCWSDLYTADEFSIMRLWVTTHETQDNFYMHETWLADEESGCYISKYFENGQSVWFYVDVLHAITGEKSERSYILKQTPPITAYIINWPDMFQDLIQALEDSNQNMQDYLDGLVTPSPQAMNDLQNALNNLANTLGIGNVNNAGNQLQNGLGNIANNLQPPLNFNDGNGTFTGGSNPNQLPYNNNNTGNTGNQNSSNLTYPNVDDGTMNDFSFRIPYMVDQNGNFIYIKLFTDEQLEKMKWLDAALKIAEAIIYIFDAFYLLSRFAPQFKS